MSIRNRIKALFVAATLCIASPVLAGPLSGVVGTWVAVDSDSPITLLEVSQDTQSQFAVGSVAVSGDCWQCDATLRNVFGLPMNKFAVFPVALDGD
jgi:hypothetical protein